MKWLRKLLGLCDHNWETISTIRVTVHHEYVEGYIYHQQCKHCGKLKKYSFSNSF